MRSRILLIYSERSGGSTVAPQDRESHPRRFASLSVNSRFVRLDENDAQSHSLNLFRAKRGIYRGAARSRISPETLRFAQRELKVRAARRERCAVALPHQFFEGPAHDVADLMPLESLGQLVARRRV